MSTEDDTDEILEAALNSERFPYPIKRANPFPTRNPENLHDPLGWHRPISIPLDLKRRPGDKTLVDLMLESDEK